MTVPPPRPNPKPPSGKTEAHAIQRPDPTIRHRDPLGNFDALFAVALVLIALIVTVAVLA